VNPKSGKGKHGSRVRLLAEALQRRNIETICLEDMNAARTTIRERSTSGRLAGVVACGGDGTLNTVLNATPPGLPISVFPCGTSNLMAKYLRMPSDPEEMARILVARRLKLFDCGRIGDRLFLLTLSAGFDAAIAQSLEARRSGPIHRLSFIGPIYRCIRKYSFPELRVIVSREDVPAAAIGSRSEFICRWCFVQNLPAYALLLNFTPKADGCDGLLDFCLYERPGFLNGLLFAYRVLWGRHRRQPDCHLGRGRWIHVEALDSQQPVAVQIDGEPVGNLPIDVGVEAQRASFIVP
jgi:diacylglycerol kinase family enzyme